jgi:acetyl esterase/lipase
MRTTDNPTALVPTAVFPTQLRQATLAIQHIISSGVKPENIQIVGDSAGANLALSLLSHMLHPLEGVPHLSLTSRIRGVYLMSPWTSLTGDTGSHLVNDKSDIVGAKTFGYCGRKVFAGVPESRYPYLEASKVPDSWFKGIDRLVDRVLITAGGAECLRDDIAQLSRKIAEHHPEATFIVHAGGIHNDPYYDFLAGETNLCELTLRILNWLAQGLS